MYLSILPLHHWKTSETSYNATLESCGKRSAALGQCLILNQKQQIPTSWCSVETWVNMLLEMQRVHPKDALNCKAQLQAVKGHSQAGTWILAQLSKEPQGSSEETLL